MTDGLDYLGIDSAQTTDIIKRVGGMFSNTGGLLTGAGVKKEDAADILARERLEADKRRAEESAAKLKLILGIGGAAVVTGGLVALIFKLRH